eukprot:2856150-Prymnesium_polylepis.1
MLGISTAAGDGSMESRVASALSMLQRGEVATIAQQVGAAESSRLPRVATERSAAPTVVREAPATRAVDPQAT